MKKALLYTITFLCIQVVCSVLVSVVNQHFFSLPGATAQIITMGLFSVAAMASFLNRRWVVVKKDYVRSRPWMVLTWCVVTAVGSIIPSLFLQEHLPAAPAIFQQLAEEAETQMIQILNTPGGYFVICLLAPVAEELVFRGAVLRALLEWKPAQRWSMVVLSALIFAVVHLNPEQMPHAFLAGILLGWMYMRTGSVVPGIAFHWANNTISYVISRLYPDPDMDLADYFDGTQRSVWLAVGFSLLILLPALFQLHVWMKKPE